MYEGIIAAIIALVGSAIGTFGGIAASARLTNFRIEQLETKVNKHNNFVERMIVAERDIKVINHRLEDLER